MRQLATARGAGNADSRQIDEGPDTGAHVVIEDAAQARKVRGAGTAGIAQRGHTTAAAVIGRSNCGYLQHGLGRPSHGHHDHSIDRLD